MSSTQKNACLSCRQRKLKCDRQRPCANCVGRSVECKQQLLPPPPTRGAKRTLEESDTSTISDILSRLDNIEAYISRANAASGDNLVSTTTTATDINSNQDNAPVQNSTNPTPSANESAQAAQFDCELKFVGPSANDDFLRHALTHHLFLSISVDDHPLHSDSRNIHIPRIQEAFRLFRVYCDSVGHFQHIIYESHFHNMVEEVYYQVTNVSKAVAPRGLALLLAVIAMATILQPLHGGLEAAIPLLKERLSVCAFYVRSSMDCLEQHRRRMDHSLESIQAMLILQFLINHIEGFSPRFRALMAESIAIAHSLGLHRIDAPATRISVFREDLDPIAKEMKRRVWWYLTAMDWMTSMAQGQSEAVYLIQPRHISTAIPRHINDEDLGNPNFQERPLLEPTSMSYNLSRLKVAELARCITEVIPQDPPNATYELISSLDAKVTALVQDFPAFFKPELADTKAVKSIDQTHSYIPLQRIILGVMIDILRCKIHFPYLTGHHCKALHTFSRGASVKAARHLLSTHQNMINTDIMHSADFMKIQGTVFHMFMGALIVATNLCCNKTQGEDRESQLSELFAAIKQLEVIRQHSQIAAKFLAALTELLVKHGVWSSDTIVSAPMTRQAAVAPKKDLWCNYQMISQDFDPSTFDDLWTTFVEDPSAMDLFDLP